MSYTALYRKFRPDTFEDVKGQDVIVKTLKNQIRANRIGHAYLFCGTRGTGKTSVAKILAKAVNCEHPVDGNPCGTCEACRRIAAGTSMNVIEIDAASNNGVDNIREIREEVTYAPTDGKYKVYIIDEVHMLSAGAFNALLKTLEEPPSYVIFILATTEVHRIPVTILSRCQRYDFRRIALTQIADHLRELTVSEQVEAEDRALRYIAKKGDGSMRDAISLLDECIAFYLGEKLTYAKVLEVLGAVDTEVFSRFLREIVNGEVAVLIRHLEELVMQGRELSQFVTDFTWYLRNLLLVKSSDDMEDVLDVSEENLRELTEEAAMVRTDTLLRYIRIFSELSGQMKYASSGRVLLEVALIKLCCPQTEPDAQSLLLRVRDLEKKVEALEARPAEGFAPAPVFAPAGGSAPERREEKRQERAPEQDRPAPETLQKVVSMWKTIVGRTKGRFRVVLQSAAPKFNPDKDDGTLYVVFADFLAEPYIGSREREEELEQIIEGCVGAPVRVRMLLEEDEHLTDAALSRIRVEDALARLVHADIEIED